ATYTSTFCPLKIWPRYGMSLMSGTSTVPKLLIRGCMKAPRALKMASKTSDVTPHAHKLSAMPTTMTSDLKCKTHHANTSDTTSELKIANNRPTTGFSVK